MTQATGRRAQARGRERANRIRTASRASIESAHSTSSVSFLGSRARSLREHMKLVKQKREEADVSRLQRFQEQLRKKEEKWYARRVLQPKGMTAQRLTVSF